MHFPKPKYTLFLKLLAMQSSKKQGKTNLAEHFQRRHATFSYHFIVNMTLCPIQIGNRKGYKDHKRRFEMQNHDKRLVENARCLQPSGGKPRRQMHFAALTFLLPSPVAVVVKK